MVKTESVEEEDHLAAPNTITSTYGQLTSSSAEASFLNLPVKMGGFFETLKPRSTVSFETLKLVFSESFWGYNQAFCGQVKAFVLLAASLARFLLAFYQF